MYPIVISLEDRVIIGISAMVILFISFLISFVINHRKQLKYHRDLHELHLEQQQILTEQNEMLEKGVQARTAELLQQKGELQIALTHITSVQAQLIQAEKMASLGELTAGIAHEIQNPLNFINNFSEVNVELINELQTEIKSGNAEGVLEISEDIKTNQQIILTHGRRADAIVKGMLQHSGITSGNKVLSNVNAFVEENFRVNSNALGLKDKESIVELVTNFDNTAGAVELVPQEMGIVFHNLLTNAFYSITEKQNRLGQSYRPHIEIKTRNDQDKVHISVYDNGSGIPAALLDKLFQPFFTTKPTGQGVGLGLSISYDIIKAHGGDLSVQSIEGEGAEFTISLPYK